jgi:hypothetical protein
MVLRDRRSPGLPELWEERTAIMVYDGKLPHAWRGRANKGDRKNTRPFCAGLARTPRTARRRASLAGAGQAPPHGGRERRWGSSRGTATGQAVVEGWGGHSAT